MYRYSYITKKNFHDRPKEKQGHSRERNHETKPEELGRPKTLFTYGDEDSGMNRVGAMLGPSVMRTGTSVSA